VNRAQVQKLARAKWGKKASVEENKHALDPETRGIVRKELERHRSARPVPPPEVVEYNRKLSKWKEEEQRLRGLLVSSRRYRIFEDLGGGRWIRGDGDTWEEAARDAKLLPNPPQEGGTA
jgi:hypothetical protein